MTGNDSAPKLLPADQSHLHLTIKFIQNRGVSKLQEQCLTCYISLK